MWIILIRSCDNFAHAMTAELSWRVQNCHLIGSSESKLEQLNSAHDFNCELIQHFVCIHDGYFFVPKWTKFIKIHQQPIFSLLPHKLTWTTSDACGSRVLCNNSAHQKSLIHVVAGSTVCIIVASKILLLHYCYEKKYAISVIGT